MPSNDPARNALDAVARRAEAFRFAITLTADQLRGYLEEHRGASSGAMPRAAAVLGAFAAGRIDQDRFAQLLAPAAPHAPDWLAPVERALRVLDELTGKGDALFRVRIERGDDLHAAVDQALAEAGRAFGAARLADLARSARYRPAEHDGLLERFPFRRWSRAERALAPPLVIELAGGDMTVAGLAAYLDGAQSFVLLVEGQAPPAPLARLIAPGILVEQTNDAAALSRLAGTTAPAVIAVMPPDAARFVHEPADRADLGRIEVSHLPAREPSRPLGSLSVFQQQQDLRLLAALAARTLPEPGVTAVPVAAGGVAGDAGDAHATAGGNGASPVPTAAPLDAVGALAAWILSKADLSDLETAEG